MTDNNTIESKPTDNRTWKEKNAPMIYGLMVFAVLIGFGLIHGIASGNL